MIKGIQLLGHIHFLLSNKIVEGKLSGIGRIIVRSYFHIFCVQERKAFINAEICLSYTITIHACFKQYFQTLKKKGRILVVVQCERM